MSIKLQFMKRMYENAPKQRSPEWHELRSTKIGSSELKNLAKRKSSRKTMSSSFPAMGKKDNSFVVLSKEKENKISQRALRWGVLSEFMVKEYWKVLKFPEIHEFGGISCSFAPLVFSPDGIFVHEEKLYLLEVKSSFLSKECRLYEYMDQIQAGLHITPCDRALLFWIKLRHCWKKHLHIPMAYNVGYHKPWMKKPYYALEKDSHEENFVGFFYWEDPFNFPSSSCSLPVDDNEIEMREKYTVLREEIDEERDPTLIKVYLPRKGKTKEEVLEDMEKDIHSLKNGKIAYVKCFGMQFIEIEKEKGWNDQLESKFKIWENYNLKLKNFSSSSL